MKQLIFKKPLFPALVVSFLFAFVIAAPNAMWAQAKSSEETNMNILREKLKADKKLVVASNMNLTDAEAKVFWPLYEEYQKELQTINLRLKNTIVSYAEAYNANTLTDEMAKKLIDETLAIGEAENQARKAYAMKFAKVLPGKKVARYLQIENKIRAALHYDLSAEIPLVE